MQGENQKRSRNRGKILYVRLKQCATTFFVIATSTLMIQNVWYPASFASFKKTWRAGVGAVIFLMGFAVARVLFDTYGEQVRQLKQRNAEAEPAPEDTPVSDIPSDPAEEASACIPASSPEPETEPESEKAVSE